MGQGFDKSMEGEYCLWAIQRILGSQRGVVWRLSWGEHAFLWTEYIQCSEASGEMLGTFCVVQMRVVGLSLSRAVGFCSRWSG